MVAILEALIPLALPSPTKTFSSSMTLTPQSQKPPGFLTDRLRHWGTKIASLLITGLVLGWAYDWAAPRFYQPERVAGFGHGALHGALMPTALPSLLMGNDPPIYAVNNAGRSYKLGYIVGINLCGLVFFGLAFRPSAKTRAAPAATPGSTQ